MNTTFYYAWQLEALAHLKNQCTIWLPEDQPTEPDIWAGDQIIATCNLGYLQQIVTHIKAGTINYGDVIWIKIKNKTATGHIFGPDGNVVNFFRIV